MKKFFSLIALLTISMVGLAQVVENFEVGPYEVDYRGPGDYNFRLRDGIDLYEYFSLEKDTTITVVEPPTSPVTSAFQVCVSMSVPRRVENDGTSNVFGIDGTWKKQVIKHIYFNAGMSIALSIGRYGKSYSDYKDWENEKLSETMFEVGVPLSLEWCNLDRKKASLYGGIGIVPTFYAGGKDKTGNKSGLFIAPRIDLGGYLPIGKQLVRIGGFFQYDINCSAGDYDIFKIRIGRAFIGGNIGLVL